jgi:hypothetical protein
MVNVVYLYLLILDFNYCKVCGDIPFDKASDGAFYRSASTSLFVPFLNLGNQTP